MERSAGRVGRLLCLERFVARFEAVGASEERRRVVAAVQLFAVADMGLKFWLLKLEDSEISQADLLEGC